MLILTFSLTFGTATTAAEGVINMESKPEVFFENADDTLISSYLSKVEALKSEIEESRTEATFTGKAYYISENGSDSNDGLTPQTAWKSTRMIANADFLNPGDAVLFERGGEYRMTEAIYASSGVIYSAYGTGAKPKLIGSLNASLPSDWNKTEWENVYVYKDTVSAAYNDIGVIVFNLGEAWGIKMQSRLNNGTVSNGIESFASGGQVIESADALKNDLEFWHDPFNDNVYLYSKDGNPAERFDSVELCQKGYGITSRDGRLTDVQISELSFFGFGSHAIGFGGVGDNAPENISVSYCMFSFIGGSLPFSYPETGRFGNAVQIYGACKGFEVHHNYADNVYDCCYTIQYQSNSHGADVCFESISFHDNIAMYSNTGVEIWLNNHAQFENDAVYSMKNVRTYNNYTLYGGYGWSHQRPNKDGNIFYGGATSAENVVYENCSVDNNVGMFANPWLNYTRYPGKDMYNFHDNVYFQKSGLYYGGTASAPAKGTGNIVKNAYTAEEMQKLTDAGVEYGTKFYSADANYAIPQYDPDNAGFSDIGPSHWAYGSVKSMVLRKLFMGTSESSFSPEAKMTRAMFVTVLARLADFNVSDNAAPFTDINESSWYAPGVKFAYNAGIADGISFRPDDPITREELADMLYRFAKKQYKTRSYENAALTFPDASSAEAAYKAGLAFAIDKGVITGYTDGSVKPKNNATRAEVSVMLKRFINFYYNAEKDLSNLATAADELVIDAATLAQRTSTVGFDKKQSGTGESALLELFPSDQNNFGNGKLILFERIFKKNFFDYGYVKLRYRTNLTSKQMNIGAAKGAIENYITVELNGDSKWHTLILPCHEILKPESGADYSANGTFYINPWSHTGGGKYGIDLFELDYIGFFPTEEAAEKYRSKNESEIVNITFTANGETVAYAQQKKGEALVYPENAPKLLGYIFSGWSLPEGSIIESDTAVEALLAPDANAPKILIDSENTTLKMTGGIRANKKSDNDLTYFRITTELGAGSMEATSLSVDATCAAFVPNSAFTIPDDCKYLKIRLRTNIKTSAGIDLVMHANSQSIWGPRPKYTNTDGAWFDIVLDLTKDWTGGGGLVSNRPSNEYYEKYIKGGTLDNISLKPFNYTGPGAAMGKDDYIDVAYIAFFDSYEKAANYNG